VHPEAANAIFDTLHRLKEQYGVTIIIVTHDYNVASRVDRVVGMRDGRTSVEVIRRRGEDGAAISEEEFAILDRAGRLQLPQAYIEALQMEDRVKLRLRQDHVGVYPDHAQPSHEEPPVRGGVHEKKP
jgi:energy-coupling factor transporter ATP-binding protein EcfA2